MAPVTAVCYNKHMGRKRGASGAVRVCVARMARIVGLAVAIPVVTAVGLPTASATGSEQHRSASIQDVVASRALSLTAEAVTFEHGEGVPRDPVHAALLYCEAARLGSADAMFALGWMYANGRGVERNDAYAGALFGIAAKKGNEHARRMLRFTGEGDSKLPECLIRRAEFFADSPQDIEERIRRFSPERQKIARLVLDLAPQYQISPSFALAVAITESALNPVAVSPKNAMGVMQLIPDTAARFKVHDIFNPEQNIRGGLAYLRWLLAYFEGDVALAAAAYNAGEGAVERHLGVPPFRETRAYVKRIMAFVQYPDHPYDSGIVQPSAALAAARARRNAEAGS